MEKVTLLKVGGICAILYTIAIIVALILGSAIGALDAEDAAEVLPIMEEDQVVAATVSWLFVLGPILVAIAGLGFFHRLRQAGPLMWIALVTFSGGGFLIVYRGSIFVAMTYELAPAYVAASGDTERTIAAVGDTLLMFATTADYIGAALVAGIGLPLFSWAILRTNIAPKWVAWLGFFAAAIGGWLTFLRPVTDVIEITELFGGLGYFVWMIVMGVVLWRAPEPVSA